MDKVYLIHYDWVSNGDGGHEVLAVTDADNVNRLFNELVERKLKECFLSNYFKNGKVNNTNGRPFSYERTDKYFNFEYNYGECFCIISAEEKEIMKQEANIITTENNMTIDTDTGEILNYRPEEDEPADNELIKMLYSQFEGKMEVRI